MATQDREQRKREQLAQGMARREQPSRNESKQMAEKTNELNERQSGSSTRIDQLFSDIQKQSRMTEKQRRILETAIELFAEKGYNGVSTSEIAKKANVAEATIFKHFKTKKGLLLSIVYPVLARATTPLFKQTLESFLGAGEQSFEDEMFALLVDRIELLEKNWSLVKVVMQESMYHPELKLVIEEHLGTKVIAIIERVIQEKQEAGQFRSDLSPFAIGRAILSSVWGYVFVSQFLPDSGGQREEQEDLRDVIDILLHGVAAPPTV
ncbi:TetR/AcrR family transcriptional regulator [Numidum massiliense]|uniref:TetR/AcrR family transcriptional regulator n=1 Tax=Numidum massiliense TaxID=1522315 RepID=UPI0006D52E8F|nr:TetR/AcrR family transcriptional regulator [Numidum massiliense]